MNTFDVMVDEATLEKTVAALKVNGIEAIIVDSGEAAKAKVLEMIPQGAEVMNMSSVSVDSIGLAQEINESGKYNAVKPKLNSMDRATQGMEMQKLGAAPEWSVGSVHAVTEDGKVVVASNTGSQLSAYAYGAAHVVWVVGTQKIVPDLDSAMKRIYDYVLPLESVRLNKQYNMDKGSYVSKLLIFNREFMPGRITIVFVKEKLGF
jgi:hypothetical protein